MCKGRRFQGVALLGALFFALVPALAFHYHVSANAERKHSQQTATTDSQNMDTLPVPSWWNGYDCDNARYSQPKEMVNIKNGITYSDKGAGTPSYSYKNANGKLPYTFRGVEACGPSPAYNKFPGVGVYFESKPSAAMQLEWECVELVMRYLYLAYGIDPYSAYGSQVVTNYYNTYIKQQPGSRLQAVMENLTNGQAPQAGDILSFGPLTTTGHTAMVISTDYPETPGNGTIKLLQQNFTDRKSDLADPTFTMTVSNGKVEPLKGYPSPIGWLHDPLLLTDGVHAPSSIALGVPFTASYTITNTGNAPFDLSALQLIALTPNGQRIVLYSDKNSMPIPVGQARTLTAHNISILPNSSGCTPTPCGAGTYTFFASVLLSDGSSTAEYSHYSPTYPHYTTLFAANGAQNRVQASVHGFTIVSSPSTLNGCNNYLEATSASSKNDVWAVGNYDCSTPSALIEHWNGRLWSISSSPYPPNETSSELSSVSADAKTDAWAVGSYTTGYPVMTPYSLIEHWNGTKWSIDSRLNIQAQPLSVKAFSPQNVWAVGSYTTGGIVSTLIVHWDGGKWNIVASPNGGINNSLYGIAATSTKDIWAVGDYYKSNPPSQDSTLIEHWNGTKWRIISSPTPTNCTNFGNCNRLSAITATSTKDAWATTWSGTIEHWDGTKWSIVLSDSNRVLFGIAAISRNDVWAVGQYISGNTTTLLVEHWNGTKWSVIPTDPTVQSGMLEGVIAMSANSVWVVGEYSGKALAEHYN